MKRLFIFVVLVVLLVLTPAGSAFGTTRYIATNAGTFTGGTACNGQTAITPATWNGTAEAPDDLSWVCGTLTGSTTTLLTMPTAGTAGHPITLKFDTSATITYPAIPVAGAIVDARNYTVIDGNSLAGTITSTTNGDCAGCLTTTQSIGIVLTCSNCEVKNLNVGPIFQRSTPTDTSSNGNATAGIEFNQGDNIKADGNIVTNAFIPIYVIYQTLTSAAVYNNITDYSSHHIVFGDNNASASGTGILIYGNTLGPHFNIWQDTGSQTMHADGIFVFAGNAGSTVTAMIYNNTITGDMCTSAGLNCTAYIYLDGNNNSWVFNNRVQHLSNTGTGPEGGIIQRATANNYSGNHIVNNTYIGGPNAIQFKIGTTAHTGTGLIAENNIWSTGQYLYGFGANNFNELGTSDNNVFYAARSDVAVKGVDSSPTFYASLGNWQAISSQDSHSVSGNPLLTSFVPQTGSSAILQGVNLYSSCSAQPNPGLGALCFDALGNARNSSTKWTAGAVEYQGGGGTVVTPVFTPGGGTYSNAQSVVLSTPTSGATICYTTNGVPPTATVAGTCDVGSTTYTTAISVSTSKTILAIGTLAALTNSSVGSAIYAITYPQTVFAVGME